MVDPINGKILRKDLGGKTLAIVCIALGRCVYRGSSLRAFSLPNSRISARCVGP